MSRRHTVLAAFGVLASSVALVVTPATPVHAATFSMTVVSPIPGRIGIDAIYQGGGGGGEYNVRTCTMGDEPTLGWNAQGQLVGTRSVPDSAPGLGALTQVRFEMYPGECGTYDPWVQNVGGVHIEVAPSVTNLGEIRMPVAGQFGGFRIDGPILSSTPITAGRVHVDSFQIPTGYPDPPAPLQQNGRVQYGAFSSSASKGAMWTSGVGWAGRYIMFVEDRGTGTKITTTVDIAPNSIPTIDLDAVCFGFDTCTYGSGAPTTTAGTFHPMPPTRILDTRHGLGIAEAVRSGDGRHPSPNPITRRDEAANHDLQVTGRFGIPSSGVSAVLLNVTAVGAPEPGFLTVSPKPPRIGDVFNDQGSYGPLPQTSNLNVDREVPVANLVLARVGAGGKVRLYNWWGPTHVIADVAGWFGTGGAHTGGARFTGVVPARVLDSRLGIGSPTRPFRPYESRSVQVAGVGSIPANAESVVVNVTVTGADRIGYATVFPDGIAPPDASNVNVLPGQPRANTAVVKVGAGGRIRVLVAEANADVIIDVVGSFGPSGGRVTSITPERLVDTRTGIGTERRALGPVETRTFRLAGRGSVPSDATAVIANVTATNTTSWGYLTAWPAGSPRPGTSSLNFIAGQTVPNLVILRLGTNGSLSVFNDLGSADVFVDVLGYVR